MRKGKFLILGLIALLLTGGLVLASCGSNCPSDGKCEFTLTGAASGRFCENYSTSGGCFGSSPSYGAKCKC